jgi:integrase
MSVSKRINENGDVNYSVYVCVTSRLKKSMRVQRRRANVESLKKAQSLEKELLYLCHQELREREGRDFSWGAIVKKWYDFERNNPYSEISAITRDDYFGSLKKWTLPFWDKEASCITKRDIREVIYSLESESKSRGYQVKVKATINKVINWGIDEGHICNMSCSPAEGVKLRKRFEKSPEILTESEVRKLLEAAKELESPWYPIWASALLSGCRSGELYALTWDDVNFEEGIIRISKSFNKRDGKVKSTKSGKWRNVPISSELRTLFVELRTQSNSRKEVLPRLRDWTRGNQAKAIRQFSSGMGLPSIKFHTLRACFATILIQKGNPPAVVMKICGWSTLETMARYVRLAGIDEAGVTDSLRLLPNSFGENVISLSQ